MFRMLSRWKPNFWVRSRKISSISSLLRGMFRSADHAGYWSRDAPGPKLSTNVGAPESVLPMRGGPPRESADGAYF
jgi:hypothetical protein